MGSSNIPELGKIYVSREHIPNIHYVVPIKIAVTQKGTPFSVSYVFVDDPDKIFHIITPMFQHQYKLCTKLHR